MRHCARPRLVRDVASLIWFAKPFARLCSNRTAAAQSPYGMESPSDRPLITTAFTTTPDAAEPGRIRRQRGLDCLGTSARSPARPGTRAMGRAARGRRKAPYLNTRCHRNVHLLERNANRDVALAWKNSIYKPGTVKILSCELKDLARCWEYFRRTDLHKLSAVDATSFVIMKRARIRVAFAFDHHFVVAGFRLVG